LPTRKVGLGFALYSDLWLWPLLLRQRGQVECLERRPAPVGQGANRCHHALNHPVASQRPVIFGPSLKWQGTQGQQMRFAPWRGHRPVQPDRLALCPLSVWRRFLRAGPFGTRRLHLHLLRSLAWQASLTPEESSSSERWTSSISAGGEIPGPGLTTTLHLPHMPRPAQGAYRRTPARLSAEASVSPGLA